MKALLLGAAVALVSLAEPPRELGNASMGLEGLHVKITVHTTGKSEPRSFGVSGINKNSFRREFGDGQKTVFAYVVQVERLPNEKRVRVVIKPAPTGPTFASERELPILFFGDKATLEVMSNPTTGERITDTIEVFEGPLVVNVADRKYPLGFYRVRVSVNGKLAGERPQSTLQGDILMFYIQGRGSYFFSTKPVPGWRFAKIGAVDGNRLTFQHNADQFEVVSEGQIVSAAPQTELWVLHESRRPAWIEEGAFHVGAADKMESFYRNVIDPRYALGLFSPKVRIDGELVGERPGTTIQTTGILALYIPGRGAYFLSTRPVAGRNFARIGTVNLNKLTFQHNGARVEVVSRGQILSEAEDGELWILHDPQHPKSQNAAFSVAGADKMEDFYRD